MVFIVTDVSVLLFDRLNTFLTLPNAILLINIRLDNFLICVLRSNKSKLRFGLDADLDGEFSQS